MTSGRPINVSGPLNDGVLLFHRMTATEELSRLFRFDLDLLSEVPDIDANQLLGQSMTVSVDLPEGGSRHYNGIVSRFSQTGRVGRYIRYQAILRPWLWFLTRTSDCRIFPDRTERSSIAVPDIVKAVLGRHGFSDVRDMLGNTNNYKPREFCVQYRETDFNFICRLMEEEGIYFYFAHEADKHYFVMADGQGSHEQAEGAETVPFRAAGGTSIGEPDCIFKWKVSHEVQTGAYAIKDFDFELPGNAHLHRATVDRGHTGGDYEIFDYPGEFIHMKDGGEGGEAGDPDADERADSFVQTRLQELQARHEVVEGIGNPRGLAVGFLFSLSEFHHWDVQNREYLVTSATTYMQLADYEGISESGTGNEYRVKFSAISSRDQFRPPRITPKPIIQGPQTAVVTGREGEEIWTDLHGRVKVQFHWDRHNHFDENSSCWIRVSQVWAGKKWGAIHIPRIGQEVVVEFIEGDPDRPLVTGRVYNGENKPPYDLPANQTQSGIKTRSSKEGTPDNFNEIRFEDLKGQELLYIHAEKNESIEVENDQSTHVGHDQSEVVDNDQTIHVKHDRNETIDNDRNLTVGNDKSEQVKGTKTVKITKSHTEGIGGNMTLNVRGGRTMGVTKGLTETVGEDHAFNIDGARTLSVAKDETITISGNENVSVVKNMNQSITENLNVSVDGSHAFSVKGDSSQSITGNLTISTKKLTVSADDEISLVTGSAQIIMKKSGDITIKGNGIKINASGDVVIKGSKIGQN